MSRSSEPVAPRERVEITYRVNDPIELPFRILVLADLTGRRDGTPLRERALHELDPSTFEDVLAAQRLRLSLRVPDHVKGGEALDLELDLASMADFTPRGLVHQIGPLRSLLELRDALTILNGPLGATPSFRKRIQSIVDDPALQERLRAEIAEPSWAKERARRRARRELAQEAAVTDDPERIAELARSQNWAVLKALATNPALDLETASMLMRRSSAASEAMLARVERHPGAFSPWPVAAFEAILPHIQWNEAHVARAVQSESAMIQRLALAVSVPCDRTIRRPLDRRETFLPEELRCAARCQRSPSELEHVLAGRTVSLDVVLRRLSSEQPWLREAIAAHPGCPPDLLVRLASVAPEVAIRHPSVPAAVVWHVANRDERAHVRDAASAVVRARGERTDGLERDELPWRRWPTRAGTTVELDAFVPSVRRIADEPARFDDPEGPLLRALGGSGPFWQRLFSARASSSFRATPLERRRPADRVRDPSCPAALLDAMAMPYTETLGSGACARAALRFWIACHPNASPATLARLARDADEYVARAALARLS